MTCISTILQSSIPFGCGAYSAIKTNTPTLWVCCVFLHFSNYLKYCSPVWQNSKFMQIYINTGTVHVITTYFVLCFCYLLWQQYTTTLTQSVKLYINQGTAQFCKNGITCFCKNVTKS
jgi:hypothetical protein